MYIFKKKEDFNTFDKHGFGSGEYLDSIQIEGLQTLYNEVESKLDLERDINFSLLEKDIGLRTYIHNSIISICKKSLDQRFKNYKFFIAHFIVKKPNPRTFISLHQDPMFTDQAIHPGIGVWTPLDNLNEQTGKFGFVNHAVDAFPPFQGETLPQVYKNHYKELNEHVTELNLKAGECVYFDNRMIHYTYPNLSNKIRIGVTIKIAHEDADNLTVHRMPDDSPNPEIKLYNHHDCFYVDSDWIYDNYKTHGEDCLGVLDYKPYFETDESIKNILLDKTSNIYQLKSIKHFLK